MTMAYPYSLYGRNDPTQQWSRIAEPPPPIARVARNRGLTPLQTYLRLLEEDRIDLDAEVDKLKSW
jgi:hypothetical protein